MVTDVPAEVLMQRMQEFEKLWRKFMADFDAALKTEEPSAEDEINFRKLQVDITRRAQFLKIAVPDNIFDLWKDIKKVIRETPSLRILKKEVPIRLSSFRSLWHDVSISMNQKQGQLRNSLEERENKKSKRR